MKDFTYDDCVALPAHNWMAILSNDQLVTQEDMAVKGGPNPWLRLQDHLSNEKLYITRLAFKSKNGEMTYFNNADGYFYMQKMMAILTGSTNMQILAYGIGYIKDDMAHIYWETEDGHTSFENRPIEKCGFGLIMNNNAE